jgi:hypothetical protein
MSASAEKSTITLLTSHRGENNVHPRVTLNGSRLPLNKNPTLLGLTYDTHMTFTPHTNNIVNKANTKQKVLQSLSNNKFGQEKETLELIYRQFNRPTINYASPAWHPALADSNINKLQIVQNKALRSITGCTKTTPIPHLHAETKILPIRNHLDMIGTQFYSKAQTHPHPCHNLTRQHQNPRLRAQGPATYYSTIYNNIDPPHPETNPIKHIHTALTGRYLNNLPVNNTLNEPPPAIHPSEKTLNRRQRVTLARLRAGHSNDLQHYRHWTNQVETPTCPRCGDAPEDVEHVMLDCAARAQARLTHGIASVRDLWARPVDAVAYLEANEPP